MSGAEPTAVRSRILALCTVAGLALLGTQPCGPIPGDELEGELATEPVSDWSFVEDQRHCQLELRPSDPHSVTTYCFSNDGVLYVPAIMGESKMWTKLAEAEPEARIRIGDRIYPVTLERVDDPAERLAAARAGYRKHHDEEEPPADLEVKDDCWYFRVASR